MKEDVHHAATSSSAVIQSEVAASMHVEPSGLQISATCCGPHRLSLNVTGDRSSVGTWPASPHVAAWVDADSVVSGGVSRGH